MKHNRFKDLIGSVYGKWTVTSYSHQVPNSGNYVFNTKCECGTEGKVTASRLKHGKSTQCKVCSGKENGRKGLYNRKGQDDLYFIRQGDYVKIGVTGDIDRRLKDLQSSNPNPLELLYRGIGEGSDEQMWHDVFEHRHHRGEWFKFEGPSCEIS